MTKKKGKKKQRRTMTARDRARRIHLRHKHRRAIRLRGRRRRRFTYGRPTEQARTVAALEKQYVSTKRLYHRLGDELLKAKSGD